MMVPQSDTQWASDPADRSFESFAGEIYGWAYRLLGRHHDALDVVQDVFIRWNRQCVRDTPQQPRGWLRSVTLNRSIDLIRQRRVNQPLSDAAAWRAAWPHEAGPERDELRADVAVALEQLSDIQRAVLVAKVYDELTFAQIAEELDVAVSTAKTHYVRALARLGAELQPRWDREDLT